MSLSVTKCHSLSCCLRTTVTTVVSNNRFLLVFTTFISSDEPLFNLQKIWWATTSHPSSHSRLQESNIQFCPGVPRSQVCAPRTMLILTLLAGHPLRLREPYLACWLHFWHDQDHYPSFHLSIYFPTMRIQRGSFLRTYFFLVSHSGLTLPIANHLPHCPSMLTFRHQFYTSPLYHRLKIANSIWMSKFQIR